MTGKVVGAFAALTALATALVAFTATAIAAVFARCACFLTFRALIVTLAFVVALCIAAFATIVAITTTAATATATATAFAVALAAIFFVWYRIERTLSIHDIVTRSRELFYWAAILCTFALGTAAGDLATEALGLGFTWGAVAFGVLIGITYTAWRMGGNAVLTFWIAYILTRPFGAALGDLLTQAKTYGGLGMGAMWTSALFLTVIVMLVAVAQIGMNGRRSAQLVE